VLVVALSSEVSSLPRILPAFSNAGFFLSEAFMREIKKIIVHCAATPPSMDIGAEEIDSWHRERGFDSIGYHYVIRRDGRLEKGRSIGIAGAHARGHNFNSIGVCLVGGVDDEGQPENNFTRQQMKHLRKLLDFLTLTFEREAFGHRDMFGVSKACPSFDLRDWYYGNE